MPSKLYTPPPTDFGVPEKFSQWRDGQDRLFWDVIDSDKRFSIHNASVGCGKSLAYIAAALATGKRVAVLTESKGLQDQIAKDFGGIGLFDMRGLSNYNCIALEEGGHFEDLWKKRWGKPSCDIGPCGAGLRCDLKNEGCNYFDAYRFACGQRLVSTNYAYWIAIHKYGQGLGKFDWLVCDEAHSAEPQLSAALSVEFTKKDFKELGTEPPKPGSPLQNWRMWGRVQLMRVQGRLDFFAQGAKIGGTTDGVLALIQDTDVPDAAELKFWKKLESKCQTLSESSEDWVIDLNEESGTVRMAPVWVRQYAESHLFLNIPRVIMMSATVRPKTADVLNIPASAYSFSEYPSTFPVDRRPIFFLPTVALNVRTPQSELRTWVVNIDRILALYLKHGLKGIIHTVSYERQQYILAHSRYRDAMFANMPGNTRDVVKAFRESSGTAILVSPSVGTGFDFPYEAARFQIIAKLPFRDTRGAVLRAQSEDDPEFMDYLVAQDILQMYGRINRAPDDCGHTWIIDSNMEWFIKRRWLFPQYFLDAYRPVESISADMEYLVHAV